MNGLNGSTPTIYEQMNSLADPVRGRMLLVLEAHELSVAELQSVLQLPQSTVSRHLKALTDESWLMSRADGTSRHYRMVSDRLENGSRKLWHLVREQVTKSPSADQDGRRLDAVLARRRGKSQKFFSSSAGKWDAIRTDLFGQRADLQALLGLLDTSMVVGDLGCGTGQVAESLSPFVGKVIAVDESSAMLTAAKKRLGEHKNVSVRAGSLESLPISAGELDAALLFLVLHHIVDPEKAVMEAARTLSRGGRLLIVDMTPHDRHEFEQAMGHLWLGFSELTVAGWMKAAGLDNFRYVQLPADPAANGPTLFAATARRREAVSLVREGDSRARRKTKLTLEKTA
jgi:ubiquinone/menaquinone biosynthesis C-methylase UbiE